MMKYLAELFYFDRLCEEGKARRGNPWHEPMNVSAMDCHVASLLAKTAEGRWLFARSFLMADAMQRRTGTTFYPVFARRPKADAAIHSTNL